MSMIIIFIIGFISFFIGLIILITWIQQGHSKKILKNLSHRNMEHIRIGFLQSQTSNFSIVAGIPIKAEMYFDKDLILICPKKGGFLNGMHNLNLPIIFTNKTSEVIKESKHGNVVNPTSIKLTDWNSLNIKYEKPFIVNNKYSIQIKGVKEDGKEKMNLIKEIDLLSITD